MMFLFQVVGAQKLASDDALRQTQVAFQKFSSMVSKPNPDPVKTVSPALVPLVLFESNFDSSKGVKDAFSKGDLGGIPVSEVFGKYRSYLETVKGKIDGKLYEETVRILDKIAPAKQQEAPDAKKSDYYQKTQTAVVSDALTIERQIFNSFVQGKAPQDGLYAQLKSALDDDTKYANFMSILRGGVVDGKFFTSNWENFKTLVQLVDSSSSTRSRAATVFECGTKEEAGAFNAALSQIKCIRLTKAYVDHVNAQLNDPRYAPAIFTYVEPETQEKPLSIPQAPATVSSTEGALSRANVYRMSSQVNYKILPGKMDVMPTAGQTTLSSKSDLFDINYNASQQVLYARHFDPNDSESLKLVSQLAGEQLGLFLADKGLTLKGGEIFAKDGRKYSKDEKLNLLKDMKIVGSATLESPGQWKQNRDLALARGKMLGEAIIGMMFEGDIPAVKGAKQKERDASQKKRDAEIAPYMAKFNNGKGIEADVVSPWYSKDLNKMDSSITAQEANSALNSIMGSIKSGGDAYAKEICEADDKKYNFNTPQFLLSLMTGKDGYKDARALLDGSTLPKKEKDQLLRLVTLAEKTSGGKPAVTYDEKTGQYSFTNEALAQKLWLTQDGANIGLRYESAKESGGKLVVSPPKTAKERLGAFFVSSLEEGYTRSASLLRSSQGSLSINLLSYHEKGGSDIQFTPPSQVAAGKTYYATLSVAYKVGGKNEIFNGKVYAEVNKGNVYAWANNKDTEARLVKVNDDNTCIYELKFTPKAGEENRIDAVAYKFLGDKRVSSGFVAAPLNLAKEMQMVNQQQPVEVKKDKFGVPGPEFDPVVKRDIQVIKSQFQIPASFAVSGLFPNGENLMQGIGGVKGIIGVYKDAFNASYDDSGTKAIFNLPSNISADQNFKFRQDMSQLIDAWVSTTDPNTKVSVQKEINDNLSNTANYSKFITAMKNGSFQEAQSYLTKNGTMYNALGEVVGSLKNFSSYVTQTQLVNLLVSSFSTGVGVEYALTGSLKMKVYLNSDMTVLVTNERFPHLMPGTTFLMNIDIGKGWRLQPSVGGGFVLSATDNPSFTTEQGAKLIIPLGNYLSGVVGGTFKQLYRSDQSRILATDVYGGLQYKLSDNLAAKVTISNLMYGGVPSTMLGAGIAGVFEMPLTGGQAEIGLSGGVGLQKNVLDQRPYSVGVSFKLDLSK